MASLPAFAALALLLLPLAPRPARAASLSGTVEDALSGAPVAGAAVTLEATGRTVSTGEDGRYRLRAPDGSEHVLRVEAPGHHRVRLVHQRPGREARVRLVPREVPSPAELDALLGPRYGVPWNRAEARALPGAELRLPGAGGRYVTAPARLPATIRVARRFSSTCADPIQRIDTLDFEDYVAGVVPAEIGVFESVPGGPEVSRASFETFSILARTYALWYYLYKGADAEYQIDDTACNQRYDDARDDFITQVVQSTAGRILVKKADPTVVDKFEYAASCGRHGTRPEYQTDLVPDETGVVGCTNGGWCGHDTCAGHEDNPELPGTDRCLVRGTCQWGSLEWSMAGETSAFILDHYEPNLAVVDVGADPRGNLVGVVREGDLQSGADLAGATVTVDGVGETTTSDSGLYRFDGLAYGTYTVHARADGYEAASVTREIAAPGDTWASLVLQVASAAADGGPPDAGASDAGAGDAGSLPSTDAGSPDAGAGTTATGAGGGGGGGAGFGGEVTGGCGCSATAGGAPGAAALGLLLVAATRRRRR